VKLGEYGEHEVDGVDGHPFNVVQLLLYAIPHFTDFWLFGIVSGAVRSTDLPFNRAK
jgi:hypothetical protein